MCTLACVHHIYLSTVFTYSTGYHVIVDFNFACVNLICMFLPDPGVSGVRSMGLGLSIYLSPRALVDFVDVTLADDDTNSILLMMPI